MTNTDYSNLSDHELIDFLDRSKQLLAELIDAAGDISGNLETKAVGLHESIIDQRKFVLLLQTDVSNRRRPRH